MPCFLWIAVAVPAVPSPGLSVKERLWELKEDAAIMRQTEIRGNVLYLSLSIHLCSPNTNGCVERLYKILLSAPAVAYPG